MSSWPAIPTSLPWPTPFGSDIKSRGYSTQKYRFGFNNQEKDGELGEAYAFEYRIHDARLGRFLSVDPLFKQYVSNSTFAFAENVVICCIDIEGTEKYYSAGGVYLGQVGSDTKIRIIDNLGVLLRAKEMIAMANDNTNPIRKAANIGLLETTSFSIIDASEETHKSIYNYFLSERDQKIMRSAFDSEGPYSDDPGDAGGKTKFGIAEKREWKVAAKYLGISEDVTNIKKLTQTQAQAYYKQRFTKYRVSEISNYTVANAILDQSILTPGIINKNIKSALAEMGHTVSINNNRLTNKELALLNSSDATVFMEKFCEKQLAYYKTCGTWKRHGDGWKNRLDRLKKVVEPAK